MNKSLSHKIKQFIKAPLRYRTRRGFGVHSPFAYKYIMDVWSERWHYYAYSEISDKYCRLIFRTLNYLKPRTIMLYRTDNAIRRAVELGAPQSVVTGCNTECYIIQGRMPDLSFAEKTESKANFAVIRVQTDDEEILFKDVSYGMSFGNSKIRIYIMLRKLPRQDFNVWL